jgi:hypothetical protein
VKKRFLFLMFLFASIAKAAPQRVRVDGVLATSAGLPSTGSRDVEIKAYDALTAGTLLWTSAVTQATLTEGRFSIVLDASSGGTNSLMNKVSELSSTGELWFEVTIDTGASGNGSIDTAAVVAPRIRSKGVMYALASSRASTADQIRGTTVDSALAPTSGQVLTYDGTKWSASSPAVSSATDRVARAGDTMTGGLTVNTNSTDSLSVSSNSGNAIYAEGNSGPAIYATGSGSYAVQVRGSATALDVRSSAGYSGFYLSSLAGNTMPTVAIQRNNTSSADLLHVRDNSQNPLFVVGASGAVIANSLTASRLTRTDANKTLTSVTSNPSDAELGYLQGVTAPIQTQLSALGSSTSYVAKSGDTMTGGLTVPSLRATGITLGVNTTPQIGTTANTELVFWNQYQQKTQNHSLQPGFKSSIGDQLLVANGDWVFLRRGIHGTNGSRI